MTSLVTYPKFSSIAFLYFELQQKGVKLNLNFHSKSISQNYGHALQKLQLYSHWDQQNWVCIFLNCLWISRLFLRCWLTCKETKITFIATEPLVYKYAPGLHTYALAAVGEFTGGEVGPEQVNKWHGCAIALTPSRLVVVARSERSPVSSDGEAAAACPRSPGFRWGSMRWRSMRGHGSFTGG
jgi:hypothetical protein